MRSKGLKYTYIIYQKPNILCPTHQIILLENSKYEAAEKAYLNASNKYNAEIRRANDVIIGANRITQFLSPQDTIHEIDRAMAQSKEILSNAKAEYEKAYSIFSNICADLGKPPPERLLTL